MSSFGQSGVMGFCGVKSQTLESIGQWPRCDRPENPKTDGRNGPNEPTAVYKLDDLCNYACQLTNRERQQYGGPDRSGEGGDGVSGGRVPGVVDRR